MPRRKFTRKRKDQSDELADLLAKQRQIRDSFPQRMNTMIDEMQADAEELIQQWSAEYALPVQAVRDWLKRRDGSTLPELAAKYGK